MNDPKRTQREWRLIGCATLAGAILRSWNLPRLGLDHFDEGIYALAGLWITNPKGLAGFDPGTIAYAPPGFPILVGLAYLALGVRDTAAILVSIVAGIATIPVVGWLGKRTFGAGAGAAAAWLCALSGPHVAFSRMAMTDSLAVLTFLIALGQGMRFLEKPGFVRAITFGLAVGLAQNVKYNGFLSGVIVALAWAVGLFHVEHRARRTPILGLVAVVTAAACYLPWYWFVEANGGYGGLIRHQRGYLTGLSRWWPNLKLQLDQQVALSGELIRTLSWAALAWTLAWLGCWLVARTGAGAAARDRRSKRLFRIGLLAGALFVGLVPNSTWFVTLAMLGWLVVNVAPGPKIVGICWLLMSVLTPLYFPYARLWLPVHAACWMATAWLIARFAELPVASENDTEKAGGRLSFARLRPALLALACCLALWQRGRLFVDSAGIPPRSRPYPTFNSSIPFLGSAPPCPTLLQPTDGLSRAIDYFGPNLTSGMRAYARPAVFFYAGLRGLRLLRVESLAELERTVQSGEQVLLDDDLQYEAMRRNSTPTPRFSGRWRSVIDYARYVEPPTTLLDVVPETTYGPEHRSMGVSILWIMKAR